MTFPATDFQATLDDVRLNVRNATYPNTAAETEAVTALENEVFHAVAAHEQNLVNTAQAAIRDSDATLARADELHRELLDLRDEVDRAGGRVSAELADRFEKLRHRAEQQMRSLRVVEHKAEFHAERVADPYGGLDALRKRYPAIVAGRRLG